MSLSAVALYSAQTIGSTATPTTPYSASQLLPGVNNTLVGNALVFNYIIANGSNTPGQNPTITFNYAFSSTSYTPSATTTGLFSVSKLAWKPSNAPNAIVDATTQSSVPIIGNYLYYWLDVRDLKAPITLTVNAVVVPICNQVFTKQ